MKPKLYSINSLRSTPLTFKIRHLVVLATLALAQLAGAQTTYTWTNSAGGNWSTPANWIPGTSVAGPKTNDAAYFTTSGAVVGAITVNNTVDQNFSVAQLTNDSVAISNLLYPSTPWTYHVTQIPAGKTLTVSGQVFIGGQNELPSAYATYQYMVGGGTFKVTGTNLTVQDYGSTTGNFNSVNAYLDLSGLTNFIFNNTNGSINMATRIPANYASGTRGTRMGGSIILAAGSNYITANDLTFGNANVAQAGPSGPLVSGIASQLTFGGGTNIVNTRSILIGSYKNAFTISNSGGGLRIRGITGADSDNNVNITIGLRNIGASTGNTAGSLLLNGCAVDIKANALIVGENTGGAPSTAADQGNGTLAFDTGTISAQSLLMAYNTSANNANGNQATCSGTLLIGSHGTFLIGAGQLFAMATATASGPSSGLMIISNGLVNCQGPIVMGTNAGPLSGVIVLQGAGQLKMGAGSYIGTLARPITSLTLDTNSLLSISIPSTSYTNICVVTNNWPSPDNNLTLSIAALPIGITNGSVFPFLTFSNMNGTVVDPLVVLPPGAAGNLSLVGNTININITQGALGGEDQLLNPSYELLPLGTGWTGTAGASIVTSNGVATYPNTGGCAVDSRLIQGLTGGGTNVAKLTGSFVAGGSTNSWSQSVAVTAGSTLTAGAFTYVPHEDIMSGSDSFYYELDFRDTNGALVGSFESVIVNNLTCGGPNIIPLDTWNLLPTTNAMQVVGGVNTGVVISNTPTVIITVPPKAATATFSAIFKQSNATDTGSAYFDAPNLGLLAGPVPPTITGAGPNLVTLSTNTAFTCTVTSSVVSIADLKLVVQTTTLAGTTTNTTTNIVGSAGLTVTGLGTQSANVSYALATNTIYLSLIVQGIDTNGVSVYSTNSFDTLVPSLVIEASDFNYTSNSVSGLFFDTPANGGLALYTNLLGASGIDENKGTVTGVHNYYRPTEPVVIGTANAQSPSGTEQKFVTALINGDTNDVESCVSYNSVGDWLNYTRTFGTGGSANTNLYNVWCYLAASGSGAEIGFSEVTNNPALTGQLTNFLGNFGTASFTDNSYNHYVYVPLVDEFGNRLSVSTTLTAGQHTFKATVVGNPNIGFYMFVPVAPVLNPVFLNVNPDGTVPFGSAYTQFSFTVGPAQGAPILTNGISLTLNGVTNVLLNYTALSNGRWTATYPNLQSNTLYTAIMYVTNTLGVPNTLTVTFDTFDVNLYQWEAVDYDYSTNNGTSSGGTDGDGWICGLYIDNPMPTCDATGGNALFGTLLGNSYFSYPSGFTTVKDSLAGLGALAHNSVDMNYTNLQTGINDYYRADGVGSQPAQDYLRPKFLSAQTNTLTGQDPNIGPILLGFFNNGNWMNYTRNYPTNQPNQSYNIYGRLAGGSGAFGGTSLSIVNSGVGTSNQVATSWGTFADANPAGWTTWHWIPLLTNGVPAVVQFPPNSQPMTLRLTSGGNINTEFMMLVPVTPPPSPFSISASLVAGKVLVSIPTQSGYTYKLWSESSLVPASWAQLGGNIAGDGNIHVITNTASGQTFYRATAQ